MESTQTNLAPVRLRIGVLRYRENGVTNVPVYLFYRQFGKLRMISLEKSIPIKSWSGVAPEYVLRRGKNAHPNAVLLNGYLNGKYAAAERIILEAEIQQRLICFDEFKFRFLNGKNVPFVKMHREFVKFKKTKEKVSEATLKTYETRLRKVQEYESGLTAMRINKDFLDDYALYLTDGIENAQVTTYKAVRHVCSVIGFAKKKGLIPFDAVADYEISKGKAADTTYLTEKEVKILRSAYERFFFSNPLQITLQKFLCACYSGMDFGCIHSFNYRHLVENELQEDNNIELLIRRKRAKNGQPYTVPVVPELHAMLRKQVSRRQHKKGKIFSPVANQTVNDHLKIIAARCGISKNLTFHVGRHTFATMFLNRGVREEVVQSMLGHTNSAQTQHYAKMLPATVIREVCQTINKWQSTS